MAFGLKRTCTTMLATEIWISLCFVIYQMLKCYLESYKISISPFEGQVKCQRRPSEVEAYRRAENNPHLKTTERFTQATSIGELVSANTTAVHLKFPCDNLCYSDAVCFLIASCCLCKSLLTNTPCAVCSGTRVTIRLTWNIMTTLILYTNTSHGQLFDNKPTCDSCGTCHQTLHRYCLPIIIQYHQSRELRFDKTHRNSEHHVQMVRKKCRPRVWIGISDKRRVNQSRDAN